MVSSVKLMLAFSVLATLACTGNTIRCYICDDSESESCGLSDSHLKECTRDMGPNWFSSPKATGCMKSVTIKFNNRVVTYRDCYFGDTTEVSGCRKFLSTLAIEREVDCSVCKEDKCNGSSSLAPFGAILLFFGVASLLS